MHFHNIRPLSYRPASTCCLLHEACSKVAVKHKGSLSCSSHVQVTLEAEISREQIPLRNAYRHVGQKASIRVNSGVEYTVPGERLRAVGVRQALTRVIHASGLHAGTP